MPNTWAPNKCVTSWRQGFVASVGLIVLGFRGDVPQDELGPGALSGTAESHVQVLHDVHRSGSNRVPFRGTDFPDGVLALTWDDGPDFETLTLARYMHNAHVSATFFVVAEWVDGISDEPGVGKDVYATGYAHIPVLKDLVELGHRVGNHTRNHALLAEAASATVADQLLQNQHDLDSHIHNELRLFRAPGGAWSASAAESIDGTRLDDAVGPVHWDIDGKDWESSLHCRLWASREDCEVGPIKNEPRVQAAVVARRYLEQVESLRHGIVLLHDRVGAVGSQYALDLAKTLIPELQRRGYVFAAPVLAFSPLRERGIAGDASIHPTGTMFADVDGDGRADACFVEGRSISWARAEMTERLGNMPHFEFAAPRLLAQVPEDAEQLVMADVDGDRRADLCMVASGSLACAVTPAVEQLGPARFERFSSDPRLPKTRTSVIRLADIDGDGRADMCVGTPTGVACARSTGHSFGDTSPWLSALEGGSAMSFELGDVDADHRADLCTSTTDGMMCSVSTGHTFSTPKKWSPLYRVQQRGHFRLADLNGDGAFDVCAPTTDGVACALSDRHGFKRATAWTQTTPPDIDLPDLNGDGRADLCGVNKDRLDCGFAP